MPMPMTPTLILLGISLLVVALAWWRDRQPYQPGNPPLVSPAMIMYVAVIVSILMAAHLIGLLSGNQFSGRAGF